MFTFLAPAFLWIASAAIIPLALHLFQRRKKVTVRFSTVRFLKLAQRRSSSRVRMENFLLWLLRTAVILLLVFAFSLPVLRRKGLGGLLGQARREVAIVWDASFSMDYRSGNRAVWEDAKEAAATVVSSLQDGDRVCIFLAGDEAVPLIEQPTADLTFALTTIRAQTPRATGSRLQPALSAAARTLKAAGPREKELYVITDGQALAWSAPGTTGGGTNTTASTEAAGTDPAELDKSISVFLVAVGATAPENTAPAGLEVRPQLLLAGRPVGVRVDLAHTGAPRGVAVSLHVDGEAAGRRDTTAGAATGEPVIFNIPALEPGPHAAWVETSEDGLALDDKLYFLLPAAERIQVLVAGSEEATFFVRRALQPSASLTLFDVKRVDPAAVAGENLGAYAAVILCDAAPVPGPSLEALEAHARGGGTVVLFPGDQGRASDYDSWTTLPARVTSIREFPSGAGRRNLRLAAPRDPLFATLKLPPGSVPSIAFQRALGLGELQPDTETLMAAGDDQPFLLRHRAGEGQVLLFTSAAGRVWSDFPLTPVFLPVLHQIVLGGAGGLGRQLAHGVAERLEFTDRTGRLRDGMTVRNPAGENLVLRARAAGGGSAWELEGATLPGIYTVEDEAGKPVPVLALNAPRDESNLELADLSTLGERLNRKGLEVARDRTELARQIEEHRVGRPLGELALWLALVLAALEVVWANRISRAAAPGATLVVDPSGRVKGSAA